MCAFSVESEVEAQDHRLTRRQETQRLVDAISEPVGRRLPLRVCFLSQHEAVEQCQFSFGVQRRVETDVTRDVRPCGPHELDRRTARRGDLAKRGLPRELLSQRVGRPVDARKLGDAIRRQAHDVTLTHDGGLNGLPNPPHRIRDETNAPRRVEVSRCGEQADVSLADQVDQRQAAMLVGLGHGDHEAKVAVHERSNRSGIARSGGGTQCALLGRGQQREPPDVAQVAVNACATTARGGGGGRALGAPPSRPCAHSRSRTGEPPCRVGRSAPFASSYLAPCTSSVASHRSRLASQRCFSTGERICAAFARMVSNAAFAEAKSARPSAPPWCDRYTPPSPMLACQRSFSEPPLSFQTFALIRSSAPIILPSSTFRTGPVCDSSTSHASLLACQRSFSDGAVMFATFAFKMLNVILASGFAAVGAFCATANAGRVSDAASNSLTNFMEPPCGVPKVHAADSVAYRGTPDFA